MSILSVSALKNEVRTALEMEKASAQAFEQYNIRAQDIHDRIDDIFRTKSILNKTSERIDRVQDSQWLTHSMLATSLTYSEGDDKLRFWSIADMKFEDTSLGGNYVINPRPQFTRYADTRSPGLLSSREQVTVTTTESGGMGLYYSEAIDSTHQTIHMRFGLPEFNSLIGFTRNFFNRDMNRLATRGRLTPDFKDILYYSAKVVVGFPFILLHGAEYLIGKASDFLDFIRKIPASKYYYMRPTMVLYWSAVTNMVNTICTYKGWFGFQEGTSAFYTDNGRILKRKQDQEVSKYLHAMMGDVFSDSGFIDIYAVANRAARMRIKADEDILKSLENAGNDPSASKAFAKEFLNNRRDFAGSNAATLSEAWRTYMEKGAEITKADPSESVDFLTTERAIRSAADETSEPLNPDDPPKEHKSRYDGISDYIKAVFKDGADYATFRVDHTGSVSEGFQSSTGETDIAEKFNSISAQGRAAKYGMFGGNIDGGVLDAVKNGLGAIISGGLSGIPFIGNHLNNLMTSAGGSAYVEIPEYWQNSSADMPSMSYTMQLISPYGNPLSQLINIYIPLAMVLAGALPLSTGKHSYTAPFLCQLFDQGRCQTRLGMITDVRINRGTSNLPFNRQKQALAIDVSFTVKDLSTVMHMPISHGFALDPLSGAFDEDTIFTDYMSVLAGSSLGKNIYVSQKLKKRLMTKYKNWQQISSPSFWASFVHDMTPVGMLDLMFKEVDRV